MALLPGVVEAFRFEVEMAGGYTTLTRSKRLAVVSEKWRDVKQLHTFVWLGEQVEGTTEQPRRCVFKRIFKSPGAVLERMDGSREAEIMGILSHKAYEDLFVTFYGWGESPSHFHICMEYLPHGSLDDCIPTDRNLPENEASCIVRQILEGLNIIHRLDLIHQDIKPQNILVKSPSPRWWVKIADFGFSRREITTTTSVRGHTVGYGAPELQDDNEMHAVTRSVDIWSLGCLTHKLLTRSLPFSPRTNALGVFYVEKRLFNSDELVSNFHVSTLAATFLQSLLIATPSLRPTAGHAISLPWIQHHLGFPPNQNLSHGENLKPTPQSINPDSQHKNIDGLEKTVVRSRRESAVTVPLQMSKSKAAPPLPPRKDALRFYGRKSDPLPNDLSPKLATKQMSNVERAVQRLEEKNSTHSLASAPTSVLINKQLPQPLSPGLIDVRNSRSSDSLQPNQTPTGRAHSVHNVENSPRNLSPSPNQILVNNLPQKQTTRVTEIQHDITAPAFNVSKTTGSATAAPTLEEMSALKLEAKPEDAVMTTFEIYKKLVMGDPVPTKVTDPQMQSILLETKRFLDGILRRQMYYGIQHYGPGVTAGQRRTRIVGERKPAQELIKAIEAQGDYELLDGMDDVLRGLAVRYLARRDLLAKLRKDQVPPNGSGIEPQKQGTDAISTEHEVSGTAVTAATTTTKVDASYSSLSALISQFHHNLAVFDKMKEYKETLPLGSYFTGLVDPEMQKILEDARKAREALHERQRGYKYPERNPTMRRKRAENREMNTLIKTIETQGEYPSDLPKGTDRNKLAVRYIARRMCLLGQQHRQAELLESQNSVFAKLSDARVYIQNELARLERPPNAGYSWAETDAAKLRRLLTMIDNGTWMTDS